MTPAKPIRFGIELRIALLAWLITLATVLIFVLVIIPEQKRAIVENLESKANGVAVSIHEVAASAVVNEDYGTLVEHCLQIVKGDPSIDYLVITKNTGESWVHEKSGWRYSQLPGEWHPDARVPNSAIGVVPEFNRRVFHYSQPFDYSGIQWGWVHVGLSLESYDRSVASVYRRTGLLALFCVLLSLIASGLYARLLIRPILTLQAVVQRIAQGDFSARASIHSGDEIELLSDSFNSMTGSLLQRDKILESVRFAAQEFLSTADWHRVAGEVLTQIGQAAEISRAYLFENHAGPEGSWMCSERFEYAAPMEKWLLDTPVLQNVSWQAPGMTRWAECLKEGRVCVGNLGEFTPAEQALLAPRRVQSLILAPILIEGTWWGFLGFEDCARQRTWTDAQVDSLRALADMVGAAIARQRGQDALLEAKQTLEQRVDERTRELREQVAATEKASAELAAAQGELIVASREAGMAEVATGVLHNVGNVLNSVNVSVTHVREKLRNSEIGSLTRVAALLEEHEGDLAGFMTTDAKGKLVPGFMVELAKELDREHRMLLDEHDQLARNVEHIKEIVAMQQNYARVSGFIEKLSLPELVEDALLMNIAGLERHGVRVIREYAEVPPVLADKHKVLQILVNLVHNGKYALDASGSADRQLKVAVSMNGGNRVKVMVADNGVGITPENLTRVFSHGFTTRRNGHGFGLHSGANAAKEMGGSLKAESAGPGKGATFTLELPLADERARS